MALSFCRQLAGILLLVAVLLAPLTSVAHSFENVMMEDACSCHMLQNDCHHESNDNQEEDDMPCDSNGDCCDHEECCHDSAEPPFMHAIIADASVLKQFYPYPRQIPPKVYLDIFVPPES